MKKLFTIGMLISVSAFSASGNRALDRAYNLVSKSLDLNHDTITKLENQNQKLSKALNALERGMSQGQAVEPIIVEKTYNMYYNNCDLNQDEVKNLLRDQIKPEAIRKCSAMWRLDRKTCSDLMTVLPLDAGQCTETHWSGKGPDNCYKRDCTLAVQIDAPLR